MELSDPKKKLIEKLHEVFDVENADLDFGIYRVMNYKRKEIDQFISNRLVQTVEQNLGLIADSERANINKEVSELEKKIKADFGDDAFGKDGLVEKFRGTPVGKTYIDKLAQLEAVQVSKDVENAIYNHILNFFSRYYDKGDFIGKRRYGRADRYVVPYNGEEALLFWATKDQYYVKTT